MKKIKLLKTLLIPTIGITVIGTIAAVSTSCSSAVHVTGVSLDKESLALGIGDSDTLIATVLPEDATDKSVTWSSSDSSIATVDNNGNVTAVGEGQATITVTTNDGGFTDTCQVTVVNQKIHVIGVWMNKSSLVLYTEYSETLTATVHPENATDKSVNWTSSDSSVATVDSNGKVTAVSEGSAKIMVTTDDGGFTDTCQVTVHHQQMIHVTGVSLDKESLALDVGEFDTLIPTVLPADATDKSVTWSSSDSRVATVDNNGKVTAVSKGSAKITVKTNDGGYEAYCNVIVTEINFIKITANADSTLELINDGGNNPNLQYSVDCSHWTTYSEKLKIPANEEIYLIGDNPNGWSLSYDKYSHFNITGNVSLSGSIMGLLDNGTRSISSIPNNSCFNRMFNSSTGITSVSEDFLPATTLAESCYHGMFQGCTSLTTAPVLSVINLKNYCYSSMFQGCTSLTTAPALPATTLADNCYSSMFQGCTSLTTAPALPATTIANSCYWNMFNGCTSLTTAPALPAMELTEWCYYSMFEDCISLTTALELPATQLSYACYSSMFNGCTSLKTAPALPATTLADSCYANMFANCTRLTTAPDLPATTLPAYCYLQMFYGCTLLASIRIGYAGTAEEAPEGAFENWVDGVNTTGTFYYKGSDTLENFGLPTSWTINPN